MGIANQLNDHLEKVAKRRKEELKEFEKDKVIIDQKRQAQREQQPRYE